MTDVNEAIVKAYYEAQGYLVKTNHYYVKKSFDKSGNKKGQGASDIDLIIIHPKTRDKAIISVKGWQNEVVRVSNIKKWKEKVDYHDKLKIDNQTIEAGKFFLGDNTFRKILVLSCFEEEHKEELIKELMKFFSYDEITDFPTILKDLIEGNKEKGIETFNQFKNYKDSEFLQSLRIFIKYYLSRKDKIVNHTN